MLHEEPDFTLFERYLKKLAPLTDEEWGQLKEMLSIRRFKKKEIFQEAGKKCKVVGFILEGCFRSVKMHDGQERTFDFAIENEFITDYHSIITQTISAVDIIAVEDTVVACVDATRLLQLFDSTFSWQKVGRHLAELVACYYQERLITSYYEAPKARYEKLMEQSPELFLRIPHHVLANYLGMTKETLSRLKNPSA
ncbi:Crp/Fnr family transcriptional regulator [Chitinophaga sp. 22321]|uniref:Crp/Fnr family transcriptional regulator n=1 Tax=Chitinophaga hostae TaxID=2831022 RepID=A0ABS5IZS3_9BACT|nr:Crp/Fnr family transcriptional regulator [Chitinophaga hostae]MBS0028281.1 Crp/Fnr family transcriptional regulator [Chitinophaga hostae]